MDQRTIKGLLDLIRPLTTVVMATSRKIKIGGWEGHLEDVDH